MSEGLMELCKLVDWLEAEAAACRARAGALEAAAESLERRVAVQSYWATRGGAFADAATRGRAAIRAAAAVERPASPVI